MRTRMRSVSTSLLGWPCCSLVEWMICSCVRTSFWLLAINEALSIDRSGVVIVRPVLACSNAVDALGLLLTVLFFRMPIGILMAALLFADVVRGLVNKCLASEAQDRIHVDRSPVSIRAQIEVRVSFYRFSSIGFDSENERILSVLGLERLHQLERLKVQKFEVTMYVSSKISALTLVARLA